MFSRYTMDFGFQEATDALFQGMLIPEVFKCFFWVVSGQISKNGIIAKCSKQLDKTE